MTATAPESTEEETLDPEEFLRALLAVSGEEAAAVRAEADTKAD